MYEGLKYHKIHIFGTLFQFGIWLLGMPTRLYKAMAMSESKCQKYIYFLAANKAQCFIASVW